MCPGHRSQEEARSSAFMKSSALIGLIPTTSRVCGGGLGFACLPSALLRRGCRVGNATSQSRICILYIGSTLAR